MAAHPTAPIPAIRRPAVRPALALAVALALLPCAAAAQSRTVGTAAAVNPRSTGGSGSATRVLELGAAIIHKERVETSATGSVQVVFVDKTTLSIGPNSSLVIDAFVYDPDRGAGAMALSLGKGALRFVGGNVSHTDGATVTTPVATIGIRGGIAGIVHHGGQTQAVLQFGILTVTARNGATEVVRRPGYMVTVGPGGITAPVRITQAQLDALMAETLSRHGQHGGRPEPTPDIPAIDQAASSPCAAPVQGQTTFNLAAVTCNHYGEGVQQAADIAAQQASQQGATGAVIPILPNPNDPGSGGEEWLGPPPNHPCISLTHC